MIVNGMIAAQEKRAELSKQGGAVAGLAAHMEGALARAYSCACM